MRDKFRVPLWLTDPEGFWPRVSAGLGILAGILVAFSLRLQSENTKNQIEIQKLSELNDRQRKVITQIGSTLDQVAAKLDKIAEDQKNWRETAAPVARETPSHTHTLSADLNGDGIVDWPDFDLFVQSWDKTGHLPTDFDRDGKVTWKDFEILAAQWMKKEAWYTEPPTSPLNTQQARGEETQDLPNTDQQ
jgi:hypothetical protein